MTGWTDEARAAAQMALQAKRAGGEGQARVARIASAHGIQGGPFKVQSLNTKLAGPPWQTQTSFRNRTVAETVAKGMRVDRAADLVRVR